MKYSIIYADPPWSYNDKRKTLKRYTGANDHYETLSIQEIKNLPINNISAENSILFIWVVMPLLQEGLDVIKSWGFKYKTCGFSWMKTNKSSATLFGRGVGHYTMPNVELCLIGIKGRFNRNKNNIYQAVLSAREEHSKKPDEVRNRIVELCGDLPRIELFARSKIDGWDVFGNEIENSINLYA
jgi:N6-adenosine-specific RNA methylase IME4